jgi:hypothetical protein
MRRGAQRARIRAGWVNERTRPNLLDLARTFSNPFEPVRTRSSPFEPIRTRSNPFKPVRTRSIPVRTRSNPVSQFVMFVVLVSMTTIALIDAKLNDDGITSRTNTLICMAVDAQLACTNKNKILYSVTARRPLDFDLVLKNNRIRSNVDRSLERRSAPYRFIVIARGNNTTQ